MAKYRKKPVVIDAVQFTIDVAEADIFDHVPLPDGLHRGAASYRIEDRRIYSAEYYCETIEGTLNVSYGDWIITGIQGEHYPCKPVIFAATYEPA